MKRNKAFITLFEALDLAMPKSLSSSDFLLLKPVIFSLF